MCFLPQLFKKPVGCWKAAPLNESQDILTPLSALLLYLLGVISVPRPQFPHL